MFLTSENIRPDGPKVFGIGLSRTGTTSLNEALNMLGIPSVHWPQDPETIRMLLSCRFDLPLFRTYAGLTDIVTVPFYRDFDRKFPGSKFILTVRPIEAWLYSIERHFSQLTVDEAMLKTSSAWFKCAVYGCLTFHETHFRDVYHRHVEETRRYFHGRPEDFLLLDVGHADAWEKLAGFLGRGVPPQQFPHENVGESLATNSSRSKFRTFFLGARRNFMLRLRRR